MVPHNMEFQAASCWRHVGWWLEPSTHRCMCGALRRRVRGMWTTGAWSTCPAWTLRAASKPRCALAGDTWPGLQSYRSDALSAACRCANEGQADHAVRISSYEVLTQSWCVQLQVLRLYARDAAVAAVVTALLCRL